MSRGGGNSGFRSQLTPTGVAVERVGVFSNVRRAEGHYPFPYLSNGRYRGSRRPTQESDESLDVLGCSR
jgi:hypothetical protein